MPGASRGSGRLAARGGDCEASPFAISLSGGSTPRLLYALLANPPFLKRFPWPLVHWLWGDERFVPHSDAKSNYRMVEEALLSQAPVPAANIHAVPIGDNDPHEGAATSAAKAA